MTFWVLYCRDLEGRNWPGAVGVESSVFQSKVQGPRREGANGSLERGRGSQQIRRLHLYFLQETCVLKSSFRKWFLDFLLQRRESGKQWESRVHYIFSRIRPIQLEVVD